MPIIPGNKYRNPLAKTLWTNERNDAHRTLDLNTIHTPQEFTMGKPPRRPTATVEQTRMPGYKPIPHDNSRALKMINDKFLHPKPEPQKDVA